MALSAERLAKLEKIPGWQNIPAEEREEIAQAIGEGAKNLGEMLGVAPGMLNSIEAMAYNYYRTKVYGTASELYAVVLYLEPQRATVWRGLGACYHATKSYRLAAHSYQVAATIDPSDVISRVYLGECLCLGGDPARGLAVLEKVVKESEQKKGGEGSEAPFLARARAIIAAKGGIPQRIVMMETGKRVAAEAAAKLREEGGETDDDDTLDGLLNSPEAQAQLEELAEHYRNHRVTLREIAGFTEDQMNAGYAAACQYLNTGQPMEALQVIGWLIYLDSKDARFYHVGGICMQHLKVYPMADYMYDMARLYGNANDPTTLVYQGEVKILSDEREAGLALVRQAIALAQKDPGAKDVVKRGEVLLKQFGS